MAGESGDAADDDELHAGAGHGYVHAAQVAEKADVAFVVASYEGYDDDVAFLALETVDGVDGYEVAEGSEEGGALDETADIPDLCPIGGDQAYVDALVKETLLANFFDVCPQGTDGKFGFVSVDASVAFAGKGFFISRDVGV